jgi:hypothetical protein
MEKLASRLWQQHLSAEQELRFQQLESKYLEQIRDYIKKID